MATGYRELGRAQTKGLIAKFVFVLAVGSGIVVHLFHHGGGGGKQTHTHTRARARD